MADDTGIDGISRVIIRRGRAGDPSCQALIENEPHLDDEFDTDFNEVDYWLAEYQGSSVGIIGVIEVATDTAQIRCLRLDPAWEESDVRCQLLHAAADHCRERGFLKIRLTTSLQTSKIPAMFECLGFHFSRTIRQSGKDVMEFYLDLYTKSDHADCLPESGRREGRDSQNEVRDG